ncbi:MAG: heme-degrading domain-containing protein [Microbacterium sp.]
MSADRSARIAELEKQEKDLVFSSFDQTDAWRLGSLIADRARTDSSPVAIDIRRPGFILFRCALPGSTPDQQTWIDGKSAVVLRMEAGTALLAERFAEHGIDAAAGWLPLPDYAVAGGSFPVRVHGVGVVAAVTVSGMSSDADHDLIVSSISQYLHSDAAR